MRYYWTLVLYWQQFLLAQIPVESTCQRRRLCRVGDQQSFWLGVGHSIKCTSLYSELSASQLTLCFISPVLECTVGIDIINNQQILHLVLYVK